MTGALLWIAAYVAVAVVVGALFALAIRHGERQHRAERAQHMQDRSAQHPHE